MDSSPAQSNGGTNITPVKRPRPVLSCLECRRKKLKCDRLLPCNQCQKSRLSCAYSDGLEPARRGSSVNGSQDGSLPPPKRVRRMPPEAPLSQSPGVNVTQMGIIEDLQARVSALERSMPNYASSGGTQHFEVDQSDQTNAAPGPHLPLSRARAHGKSLGLMANFDEARAFMQKIQRPSDDPAIHAISNQLRSLQNMVKGSKRSVTRPQADAIEAEMVNLLPSKDYCSQLLDVYFHNFEKCLRILHKPSFMAEYVKFWSFRSGDLAAENTTNNGNPTFVPRLLAALLVATTANTAPVCKTVALAGRAERASAYELLDNWGKGLKSRDKSSLHALQVGALRTLIHHDRPLSVEETWSTTGSLIRLGMAGGLHLEPDPKDGVLDGEQRRRLWATLLELELASSVVCGMPTILTPDDFTCRPPANLNDVDIAENTVQIPASRNSDEWTDSLCQSVLASSLRQRLEAYRLVTKATPDIKYEVIIDHARQLECTLQSLPAPLRFSSTSDEATNMMARTYARIHLDMAIRRTIIALYTPFAILSIEQDPYKEARVGYVQSCLVITCYQDLFDPTFSEATHGDPGAYWDLFYQDFKREMLRSSLGICLEIKWMRHLGFDSDPPGATAIDTDPTGYYASEAPSKLWKLPAWTLNTLTQAVEDTLEPMVRRVGRIGSDLKDLGCVAIVNHSVKDDGNAASKDIAMKSGLSELIAACESQLQQTSQDVGSGVPSTGDSTNGSVMQSDTQYFTPDLNFNFDDLWGSDTTFDNNAVMALVNPDVNTVWPLHY